MLRPFLSLLLALSGVEASTNQTPGAIPASAQPFPVEAIRHGQTGRCFTVFEGDTIEPFGFEVKGVMHDYLGPQGDVVLVRLVGSKTDFTGVVAGMSGSPCFIGDRLVGALSYAFATFAKEPIAGITPIGAMQNVALAPRPDLPWRLPQVPVDPHANVSEAISPQLSAGAGLEPIATPIAVGGCPEAVRNHFMHDFASFGLGPIHNTARAHSTKTAPLSPGSPVAVVLMRGDMDMAATGTVTWVEKGQVLAFGHPFMGSGPVSFPMAEASILNTMASSQRSFKMAATGPTVGELTQDRLAAIAGTLGDTPRMLPLNGVFEVNAKKYPFTLEVARDVALTPRLLAMGLASALTGRTEASTRGTVHVSGTLKSEGEREVPLEVVVAAEHDDALLSQAAMGVAHAFAAAWDTPYGLPGPTSLTLRARLDPVPIQERVDTLLIDQVHVQPGETIDIGVRLRRRNHGESIVSVPLVIPRAWANQRIELWAGGSQEADALAHEMEGQPRFGSRDDILRALQQRRAPGSVHVLAIRSGAGIQNQAETLRFLPPSAVTLVAEHPASHLRPRGIAFEARRQREGTVMGSAKRIIHVAATH